MRFFFRHRLRNFGEPQAGNGLPLLRGNAQCLANHENQIKQKRNASPTPLVSPDGVPDLGTLRFSLVVNYTLLVTGIGGLAAFPANFGICWEGFPAEF